MYLLWGGNANTGDDDSTPVRSRVCGLCGCSLRTCSSLELDLLSQQIGLRYYPRAEIESKVKLRSFDGESVHILSGIFCRPSIRNFRERERISEE